MQKPAQRDLFRCFRLRCSSAYSSYPKEAGVGRAAPEFRPGFAPARRKLAARIFLPQPPALDSSSRRSSSSSPWRSYARRSVFIAPPVLRSFEGRRPRPSGVMRRAEHVPRHLHPPGAGTPRSNGFVRFALSRVPQTVGPASRRVRGARVTPQGQHLPTCGAPAPPRQFYAARLQAGLASIPLTAHHRGAATSLPLVGPCRRAVPPRAGIFARPCSVATGHTPRARQK
jgi:hypothetical protein